MSEPENTFRQVGMLIDDLAERRDGFFIRFKTNYEWEVGYGQAGGMDTVRADSLIAALRDMSERVVYEPPLKSQ